VAPCESVRVLSKNVTSPLAGSLSQESTLYVSSTAESTSLGMPTDESVFNVVDIPVVTSVVVIVQLWQLPLASQFVPATTPLMRSPGYTSTIVLCTSLPFRQQFSLSIAHAFDISPPKSSTGWMITLPVWKLLKNAMS
jgi:hypothetical protein